MLGQAANAQPQPTGGAGGPVKLAGACGAYCGVCPAYVAGQCDGVCKEAECDVRQCCVVGRKLESCADCPDLPCTKLILMSNDPVCLNETVKIENLRRRKKIGTEAWLAEQKAYWSNQKLRDRWVVLTRECWERDKNYR